ncbi:MAG: hypothetical protein AAGK92_05940 [Pseudomonadota bacterium]
MFKFLFGKKADAAVVVETQRETFERVINELNAALDVLDTKPTVTVDPETGHIGLVLPEHLPDEALSLPAPEPEAQEVKVTAEEVINDEAQSAPETTPEKEEKAA